MMEATVFLGTFNAAEMIWYPSPDLCLQMMSNQLNLPQVDSNEVVETAQG
jgi:hypothetical protein